MSVPSRVRRAREPKTREGLRIRERLFKRTGTGRAPGTEFLLPVELFWRDYRKLDIGEHVGAFICILVTFLGP